MVGHQTEEFQVVKGKETSGALRWTLGFFILLIWGGLMAYIGYLVAQTVFIEDAIRNMEEMNAPLTGESDVNANENQNILHDVQ